MPAVGSGAEIVHFIATRRVAVCALGEKNRESCLQISAIIKEKVSPSAKTSAVEFTIEGSTVRMDIQGK